MLRISVIMKACTCIDILNANYCIVPRIHVYIESKRREIIASKLFIIFLAQMNLSVQNIKNIFQEQLS